MSDTELTHYMFSGLTALTFCTVYQSQPGAMLGPAVADALSDELGILELALTSGDYVAVSARGPVDPPDDGAPQNEIKGHRGGGAGARGVEFVPGPTFLDLLTVEQTNRISQDANLSGRITDEYGYRIQAEATLHDQISTEQDNRISQDANLSGRITDNYNARISNEAALSQRIDDETGNRISQDANLSGRITDNYNARISNEAALSGRIDTEQTNRISQDANLSARITALGDGGTEHTNRVNAEAALSHLIDLEQAARISDVNSEASTRAAQDANLSTRITNETNARLSDVQAAETYAYSTAGVQVAEERTNRITYVESAKQDAENYALSIAGSKVHDHQYEVNAHGYKSDIDYLKAVQTNIISTLAHHGIQYGT